MMPDSQDVHPAISYGVWPIPASILISFLILFLAHSSGSGPPPDVPDKQIGVLICTNIILLHGLLLGIVFLSLNIVGFQSTSRSREFHMVEFTNRTAIIGMILGFLVLLFGVGIITLTYDAMEYFNFQTEDTDPVIEAFSGMSIASKGLFALLVIGFVPVSEEIVFRLTMYRALRWLLPHSASALVTALVFAAAHSNFAGFPCYILFSLILQEAYRRTSNLYIPIVMHATFNLSMLTVSMY